jgi:hypothetical protein
MIDLCDEYRREIERIYGKETADKSVVEYGKGWFYIGLAKTFRDGSIGCARLYAQNYRKKDVIKMLSELKLREPRI